VPRPYGEWLDRRHWFLTRGTAPTCFDLGGLAVDAAACARSNREADRARAMSRLVVTADLQAALRARLDPDGRERE
jgi:hypothetical protein